MNVNGIRNGEVARNRSAHSRFRFAICSRDARSMLANLVSGRFNSVLECPRGRAICQIFVGKISRAAASVYGHPYTRISSSKLIRKFATLISDYFPPPFPCFFHATSFWPTVSTTLSKQDVYFWFWKIPVSRTCFESNVNLPDSLQKISSYCRNFFFLLFFLWWGDFYDEENTFWMIFMILGNLLH